MAGKGYGSNYVRESRARGEGSSRCVMSRQGSGIEIGQRYVGTGPTLFGTPSRNIWFVSAIRRAIDGLLYADLINEKDPGRIKTISTEALADPRYYKPVAGAPQDRVSASPNQG